MNYDINALTQEVKREVLAELNGHNHPANSNYLSDQRYNTDPYLYPASFNNFSPGYAGSGYQIMKESIKNDIQAEIQAQQAHHLAQMYGYDKILSDQKIQQMIDQRYRSLENMKADIKKELQSIQRMENQRTDDPYIRQVANALALEARQLGVPLEQIVQSLEQKPAPGAGALGRMSGLLNTGQRKGVLYGIGAAALVYLLWPSLRNSFHSAAVRTMEEGISIADRAKSFMGGHGHHDLDMHSEFDDFDAEPRGGRPPEVDILKQ